MKDNDSVRSQFCTCHVGCTIVTCAKLRPAWINETRIIVKRVSPRFLLWAHELFVQWVRDTLCGESTRKTNHAERSPMGICLEASSLTFVSTSNFQDYRPLLVDQMLTTFQMQPRIPKGRRFLKGNRYAMRIICSIVCVSLPVMATYAIHVNELAEPLMFRCDQLHNCCTLRWVGTSSLRSPF